MSAIKEMIFSYINMPIILDVEYSQYIHFILLFGCVILYFIVVYYLQHLLVLEQYMQYQYVHGLWVLRIFRA